MITIVLDTNILHQEGLSSGNMRLLHRLIISKNVELYLPEIVIREYVSKLIIESKKDIADANRGIDKFKKRIGRGGEVNLDAEKIQKDLHDLDKEIDAQIQKKINEWLNDFSIKILPLKSDFMIEVMDDYFMGKGVYKESRSRDDIPDAIINCSINELLKEKKSITVVIKDGVFKNHLKTVNGVRLVDTLTQFFDFTDVREEIVHLDSQLGANSEALKAYLKTENFSQRLLNYIISSADILDYVYLEEEEVLINNNLEINSFGERVESPQATMVENLIVGDTEYLENGVYSVRLSFKTTATLYYCAYYEDYLQIEDDPTVLLDSMNGEGICDLIQSNDFIFYGFAEVRAVSKNLDINEILASPVNLRATESFFAINFVIEKAELQ